ncbi:MAG: DJ-1 family glyoxalase III [Candidatus Fimenecus sp.]
MIYLFLADGFEICEAMAPYDILTRAGKEVITVGIGKKKIVCSHKITIITELEDSEIELSKTLEGIILPGGMPGTLNIEKSEFVINAVKYCAENKKMLSAICAAPSILGHLNLLNGKNATCFPGFEKELYGANLSKDLVVVDENMITAKGMGVATEFGLAICEYLCGKSVSEKISAQIQKP